MAKGHISKSDLLYIHEHPGLWFCRPCLSALTYKDWELRARANHAFAKPFNTDQDVCSKCGKNRVVIGVFDAAPKVD